MMASQPLKSALPSNSWSVSTVLLCQLGVLLFSMLLFDALIERRPFGLGLLWGPIDNIFHCVIALLVILPLALRQERHGALLVGVAVAAAGAIDLDHFLAAGSLSLEAAVSLDCRPWSHSFTLAILIAVPFWLMNRRPVAVAVLAGLLSHVLRDAGGTTCTPIFWPLPLEHIPYWTYLAGTLALATVLTLDVAGLQPRDPADGTS